MRTKYLEDRITVDWQPRRVFDKGKVSTIDANGDVESIVDVLGWQDVESYRSAGEIPITDEMIAFCGVSLFPRFLHGIMRHVAHLVVLGLGESPEEVVDWFKEYGPTFDKTKYIVDGNYRIVGPGTRFFSEMEGLTIRVSTEQDRIVGSVIVLDKSFNFTMDSSEIITDFIICTLPA